MYARLCFTETSFPPKVRELAWFSAAFWSDTGGIRKDKAAAAETFALRLRSRRPSTRVSGLTATRTCACLGVLMARGTE